MGAIRTRTRQFVAHVQILIDDEELFATETDVTFTDSSHLSRLLLRFEGFVIPRPGTLRVRVRTGDDPELQAESLAVRAFPTEPEPTITEA